MKRHACLAAITLIASTLDAFAAVPDVEDFRVVPQFPQPADGAFGVVGTNDNDGRFLLWDGDTIYRQEEAGSHVLEPIAAGYLGDPGFITLNPNGNIALLGAGFGDGTTANLFLLTLGAPEDFVEGDEIVGPSHFAGQFLNDSLVILDAGKSDFSGSELIVLDIFAAEARGTFPRTVLRFPEPPPEARISIIDKPEFSFASRVFVDRQRGRVYAMDGNTTELRWFSQTDVINAFNNDAPLDWSKDGTPVGAPGDLFTGGVSGITPDGELVIGGSAGFGQPGGIQFIDPDDPVTILDTLDPAGDMPFYEVIYNRRRDEMIAIDATFGVPIQAYATERGITPIPAENPCHDEEAIRNQMEEFLIDFSVDTDDMDGDMIPDLATLELFLTVACLYTEEDVIDATHNAYDFNLETLDVEAQAEAIEPYREIIASLMCISSDMQNALTTILQNNGITLTQDYVAVTCTDVETCLPDFVEDADPDVRAVPRAADEPYSGSGDMDDDGVTNLEEYNNVVSVGGDFLDYAIAAFSDRLTGNNGLEGGGSGGGCLIATAAYGTPMVNELSTLREWRDHHLLPHAPGMLLADTYYRLSATVTPWIHDKPTAMAITRNGIGTMNWSLRHFGPLTLMFIAILVALTGIREKRKQRS